MASKHKNVTLRINYGEGKARCNVCLIGTTVNDLRAEIADVVPHRGRSLELSLKGGRALRDPDETLDSIGLKRGSWIHVAFRGEMSDSGARELRLEKEAEAEKRATSFEVVGADQEGFPNFSRRYVYKEKQIGKMCGQHALNALLQGPYERESVLEAKARHLESEYRRKIGSVGAASPFRDSGGNYSIEVLKEVLKDTHKLVLQSLDHPSMKQIRRAPRNADGFLLHKSNHWLAIRRVHRTYWLLDSTRKRPESLPDHLISDVISTLSSQGYRTFVVCGGNLPEPRPARAHAKCWFDCERLLHDESIPGADKHRWLQIRREGRDADRRSSSSHPSHGGQGRTSDSSKVRELMGMGMGWSRKQCERALAKARGNANTAVNILLSGLE